MNSEEAVLLKEIRQIDNHRFSITWTDGGVSTYLLATLQKNCPCAGCSEARKEGTLKIDDQVTALRISSVGRYALRIQFRRGCSAGIYDFTQLRHLDKETVCAPSN